MDRRRRGATDSELLALLSPREREVLKHVARGRHVPQIADELGISHWTVQAVLRRIRTKLDIHDRVRLTLFALRVGLVTPYNDTGDDPTPTNPAPDDPRS